MRSARDGDRHDAGRKEELRQGLLFDASLGTDGRSPRSPTGKKAWLHGEDDGPSRPSSQERGWDRQAAGPSTEGQRGAEETRTSPEELGDAEAAWKTSEGCRIVQFVVTQSEKDGYHRPVPSYLELLWTSLGKVPGEEVRHGPLVESRSSVHGPLRHEG